MSQQLNQQLISAQTNATSKDSDDGINDYINFNLLN